MERRKLPWKRLFLCLLGAVLLGLFIKEFGLGLLLFVLAGALGNAVTFWGVWKKRREEKRRQKEREATARQTRERRREAGRNARYASEDRRQVEAYLQRAFGPAEQWFRRERPGGPPLDIALVPVEGRRPCCCLVTVGLGAVPLAGEDRMELVLLLPQDWEPAEEWPLGVLEAAVGRVILDGGAGQTLRCAPLMGQGFAGAVVQRVPGWVPLADGGRLCFCQLLPLLKPEWDYLKVRGLEPLLNRLETPLADPRRTPCCHPETWFEEDIAPFCWSQDRERFCLGLKTGTWQQETFFRAGMDGTGWDWETLARAWLSRFQPADLPFVDFACEEELFFAASEDEEILRRLALSLHDLCCRGQALSLLAPDRRGPR